jgi:hypothetical protein
VAGALAHLDVSGELANKVTLALQNLKQEVGIVA